MLGGREEKPESGAVARLRLSRWSGELLLDPILTEKNISIIFKYDNHGIMGRRFPDGELLRYRK